MNPLFVFRTGLRLAFAAAIVTFAIQPATAQEKRVVWTAGEKPIAEEIHGLRALPDSVRAGTTRDLAMKIRKLPSAENKLRLAMGLASLSTEGDFGHDTLQEVATTLADTLLEQPVPWSEPQNAEGSKAPAARQPASPHVELATLVRL